MNLLDTFEVAAGTTAGSRHRTGSNLANNQDTYRLGATNSAIIGAISDGCGSQPYSGFGAQLIVNLLMKFCRQHLASGKLFDDQGLHEIYTKLVQRIKLVASTMLEGDLNEVIQTHLLATAGAFVLTPEKLTIFGAGDFVYVVNVDPNVWKPMEGNAPPYPALSLFYPDDDRFGFRVGSFNTEAVQSFMFATDGGEELLKVLGDDFNRIPGTEDVAGPVKKLWATDEFYLDDTALGNWLNRLAQNWRMPGPPHHGGLLGDDTTLIVGRRKETNDS